MAAAVDGGGGFQVNPLALTETAPRVEGAATRAREVASSIGMSGCIDTGDAALSAALDTFDMKWSQFASHAADAMGKLASTISSAAVSYESVDGSVMPVCRP